MKKCLKGAFAGLVVGAVLGILLAIGFDQLEHYAQSQSPANDLPNFRDIWSPVLWQQVRGSPAVGYLLFQGILFGGGFGAVVGAISAATGAILRIEDK